MELEETKIEDTIGVIQNRRATDKAKTILPDEVGIKSTHLDESPRSIRSQYDAEASQDELGGIVSPDI